MKPQRLSLIGVGLLGGSIGLAVKSKISGCKVVGYGLHDASLEAAKRLGAADEVTTELSTAISGADLVVICTPVGTFQQIIEKLALLAPTAIVTDVGSTKRSIVSLAERSLHPNVRFVGSHPIAGGEQRGVEAARADLFQGQLCITTPTDRTDSQAVRYVESFWQALGMRTTRLTPDDHDRLLAEVSHLPHAVAAALVATQTDHSISLAGKGFLDATRIAAGDASLWRDIFLDNADNLRHALARLRSQLDRLDSLLDPAKGALLQAYLSSAAEARRARRVDHAEGQP